ncbi:hypothetical protein GS501_02330 [Saccharibacter sp. 17.LH.SD]|uniref:hypothetical protein n=1 Tax=Saccharibacter sp. 17.LH.SD TaxID=2689393 RepID=UPI00136FF19C|nr:hypothetical protein [Saccharibacter sp. 17.LH.SD]MXV43889.1 hypothetical protein [Saccharibacter sp. 17.LH.SD]
MFSCAALTTLGNSAHAESLDRVYRVQADLTPTPFVNGNQPTTPTQLTVNVSPNNRNGKATIKVQQGANGYTLNAYSMRVKIKAGPGGGSDNGTLRYFITADVGHNTATHSAAITPHVRGNVTLHNGSGQATLPVNKYFSGDIKIQAVAGEF